MELPCFGVPVVTAGSGRYSGHGFTIDTESRESYQSILSRLHEFNPLSKEQKCLARKYAFGAFFLRPIPTESFRINYHAQSFGVNALTYNVELEPIRMGLWPNVPDLQRIAKWATASLSSDLLASEPNESIVNKVI
jgi:hypothetical protein